MHVRVNQLMIGETLYALARVSNRIINTGAMHSCMFLSPVGVSFGRSTYLSCACQRRTSRGWLARRLLFPYFYWCVHHGWLSDQFGFFIFKSCVYKTLAFWKNIEDSATFLRVTLSIFDVFVRHFSMEAPKLSDNFLSLSLSVWSADIFLLPNLLDGLRSCNRVVNHLTACLVALL